MVAKASERVAILGTIDPDNQSAGTVVSDYADARLFDRILAVLSVGIMTTNGTLDAKLVQATSSAGAGAKDITGKAITQLTQAGTDSDKQVTLEVRASELDLDNGFRYVALSVTTATAASYVSGVLLGFDPRYSPLSGVDLASVDEVVG